MVTFVHVAWIKKGSHIFVVQSMTYDIWRIIVDDSRSRVLVGWIMELAHSGEPPDSERCAALRAELVSTGKS